MESEGESRERRGVWKVQKGFILSEGKAQTSLSAEGQASQVLQYGSLGL